MTKFFLKGLFALLPIALTVVVLVFIIEFLYGKIAVPLGDVMQGAMTNLAGWTPKDQPGRPKGGEPHAARALFQFLRKELRS